ncbi:MAG: hypothetical protein WAT66_07555 [Actinomycetota bacterium]
MCAAVAVAVAGAAVLAALSIRDWRVSALVRMSAAEPMATIAHDADPDFAFVDTQAHYDGVYFYAIATDPLARGDAHTKIDKPAYRYGHAGLGWLAWLASGGRTSAVPGALLAIGLAGTALAAYGFSLLGRQLGWTPWAGLIVAFSPGIIYAVTADTSEPIAVAALAFALLGWLRGRYGWAAVALAAGCFIKEPLILVPVGLGAWTLVEALRGRREGFWARASLLVIGPLLYAGWYAYLRGRFGVWPSKQATDELLSFPLSGWIDSLKRAASLANQGFENMQIGNASVAFIVAIGALLLIGVVLSLRLTDPIAPVFILLAVLAFSLNWLGVLYPKDLLRETAPAMTLLPFVFFARKPEPAE